MNKYISFGEKIVKIGPVDPEIIGLRAIIKEEEKRKKLMQAKYIARNFCMQHAAIIAGFPTCWKACNYSVQQLHVKPRLK